MKRLGLPGLLAVLFMATTLMTSWATPTGCDGTPGYLRTTEENISIKDHLTTKKGKPSNDLFLFLKPFDLQFSQAAVDIYTLDKQRKG